MSALPRHGPANLDEYAERLVRFRARQLVGRYGFTRGDRQDIEQDLRLDLLRRLPRFDPTRASRNTFISRVIDHAVATIIERQTATCRDRRLTSTFSDLEQETEDGGKVPFEDGFDATEYLRLTGRPEAEPLESIPLRLDIEHALDSLPPDLQELCRLLRTNSLTEIAAKTGIPRSTLHDRVLKIRRHLRHAINRDDP